MARPLIEQTKATTAKIEYPYSPSWLNRLNDWIDRMPGTAGLYYLAGFLILGIAVSIVSWIIGAIPAGTIELKSFVFGVYPIYFVALMHYLDDYAKSALEKFRPVLDLTDTEYRRMEYDLTRVPAKGAWIATIFAVVPGILITLSDQQDPLIRSGHPLGLTVTGIPTIFTIACLLIFAYHTTRQLRMVSRIHTLATAINPFHAGPVYAFSELTARTGIGLIFFASFIILLSAPDPSDLFTYLLLAAIVAVAVAAFLLPLLGMHQRLVKEKAQLQLEINNGVEVAYEELQERVRTRNFAEVEDLDKVLSSLLTLREVAAKLSTWPWQAETLRGFISALLVPILIWILTTVLERFIIF
jgi:hypothetical protein